MRLSDIYLNPPEKKIISPQPNKLKSSYAIKHVKESREFLEEQLFGNYGFQMTMKQILFILDKSNYNDINHDSFRKKFEAIKCKPKISLSNDLENILKLYGIDLDRKSVV